MKYNKIMRNFELIQDVVNKLNQWVKDYPRIKLKFSYSKTTNFYTLEIGPEDIRKNSEFKKISNSFLKTLMSNFPEEDILFQEIDSKIREYYEEEIIYTNIL